LARACPRQVGKTTLALAVTRDLGRGTVYLDLERDSDRAKLDEAELYLEAHRDELVIIDEVQRRAEIFRCCAASSTSAFAAARRRDTSWCSDRRRATCCASLRNRWPAASPISSWRRSPLPS
jgi:hypothetical protein